MQYAKVINRTRGTCLADQAAIADSFWLRLKGLLGHQGFQPGEALVIRPCSSVHTFGMRFSLDLVFLDRDSLVCSTLEDFHPGKVSPHFSQSWQVIELPAGTLNRTGTRSGDLVTLETID